MVNDSKKTKLLFMIFIIKLLHVKSEGLSILENNLVKELKGRLNEESIEIVTEENTSDKEKYCANYANPKSLDECKAIDLISNEIFGRKHTCCFFRMSVPKEMFTCVPVEVIFLPLKEFKTNLKLPGDVNIQGYVDCGVNSLLYKFISIIIFIMIYF